MIARISGIVIEKYSSSVIINVNGVGYELSVSTSTLEKIGDAGEEVTLFTYLHVRENVLQLFGFLTEPEKQLFMQLISVNGIGPKSAQKILGGCRIEDFHGYILQNDIAALSKIPGIGKKTAENLVYELRERLSKLLSAEGTISKDTGNQSEKDDAITVLVSLGYNKTQAKYAVEKALGNHGNLGIEDLIKTSLKYF